MLNQSVQWNVSNAVNMANEALYHLQNAQEELDKAGKWGIVDILGGGLMTTALKRSKMNHAQSEIEQAKRLMNRISCELRGNGRFMRLNFKPDGFLAFADYFFDSPVTDWLAQSEINDAKRQVNEAIDQLEDLLDWLEGDYQ